MGYKEALLDAKKEIDALIKRYSSIKPRDSYDETFQKARLMGYKDAIHRINVLIEKYDSESHDYTALDEINEAADEYVGHPEEVDEGITVSGRRDAFKDGAKWQMKKDFDFFTGQMGLYDPNMEVTDEEKAEALRFAYDLDAYMEGVGPNITDVVNGYYGGLLAQRKKEKDDLMKDALDAYVSFGGKRRLISILDGMKDFKLGEKVKVIILKDKDDKK